MKVIIDTNIWISYLIGKTLAGLSKLLENDKVEIIVSDKIIAS
jgi:putative PIN family toxin of toxin-antitoxin system